MKKFIIIFSLIMPNISFAEILDKFSLACICDKSINALKYFDCKQKVSGTQLDLLEDESNKDKILIYSSFDQKKYKLTEKDPKYIFNYETENYISLLSINNNLDLVFSISYKEFDKNWSYDLKCVSLKKE
ncbi:hypothetical protein OA954_01050 [Alphaproteobacteria bacterium]|nr:hypothetical protein [Alphaproteobacteria bacterium]